MVHRSDEAYPHSRRNTDTRRVSHSSAPVATPSPPTTPGPRTADGAGRRLGTAPPAGVSRRRRAVRDRLDGAIAPLPKAMCSPGRSSRPSRRRRRAGRALGAPDRRPRVAHRRRGGGMTATRRPATTPSRPAACSSSRPASGTAWTPSQQTSCSTTSNVTSAPWPDFTHRPGTSHVVCRVRGAHTRCEVDCPGRAGPAVDSGRCRVRWSVFALVAWSDHLDGLLPGRSRRPPGHPRDPILSGCSENLLPWTVHGRQPIGGEWFSCVITS